MNRIWLIAQLFLFHLSIDVASAQQNRVNDAEKQIDSVVKTYHQDSGSGIAVSVVRNGQVIYNRQDGLANLEYSVPISDSTVFHIASVSKQFTAFLALMLEEEGKLSLDDDIKKISS